MHQKRLAAGILGMMVALIDFSSILAAPGQAAIPVSAQRPIATPVPRPTSSPAQMPISSLTASKIASPAQRQLKPTAQATTWMRPQLRAESMLPCEQYIAFIDPSSPHNDEYGPWFDLDKQTSWTPAAKRKIDRAVAEIARKAPGLLARACNGEKVALLLLRGDGAAAETDPCNISVFTNLLQAPTRFIAETLAHEMTHLIDYGANLSDSKEWNSVICPVLEIYRKEFPDPDRHCLVGEERAGNCRVQSSPKQTVDAAQPCSRLQ